MKDLVTVTLENGEKVHIPLDELGGYLEVNRDNIQVQSKKMRKRLSPTTLVSSKEQR